MSAPPVVTPDYFQILVLRELRKVGFDAGQPRVHRRAELPEPERGFVLELVIPLGGIAAVQRALVVCRRQDSVVTREIVESVKARLADTGADVAVIVATSDFGPDAIAGAQEDGIALMKIVESRSVFEPSADHYPAWLPAHMAQLVDRDAAGVVRARVLEAGRPEMLLEVIRSVKDER